MFDSLCNCTKLCLDEDVKIVKTSLCSQTAWTSTDVRV